MDTDSATENPAPHSLRNQLLIAMPGMDDERFAHTVTYLCEHTPEGAMGLVINQPLDMEIDDLLEQMSLELAEGRRDYPVLCGGPMHPERGFVLHRSTDSRHWHNSLRISNDMVLTASRDILADMAAGRGPKEALVVLGYAGWGAGQLEQELADNVWLTAPASQNILFQIPFGQRAQAAAAQLGVDLNLLPAQAGHA